MREIKFRAINHETGEFVYGYYLRLLEGVRNIDYIVDGQVKYYIHDIKTLGQFTGLKDKNGKEIYEGDIVESSGFDGIGGVQFHNFMWQLEISDPENDECSEFDYCTINDYELEVIGNIYENPEKLKECDNNEGKND